ncbi:pyridoxal-dependent decarboxylase [Chitinophaga filiformis]|uniref:Pyridoxal-dependent decarboxylase conserved domain-containing protein n=1 Tax=Chitinophaga filiformis TaxID=104663 RepID=A0A1G7HSN6_CHIFI|nr:pyridoxal-dependent decarboxylase [Chitinophaga filiformis]SDF03435.1 Pyridoxal-dependent decarboxylase conserved domain-containing protein [Chitinophaga filiformis]
MKQPLSSQQIFARNLTQQHEELLSKLKRKGTGSDDLAGWFLGPKAENTELLKELIRQALDNHCNDRKNLYPNDPVYVTEEMKQTPEYQETVRILKDKLDILLQQLKGSVPFWSYRWQSHMNWDTTLPSMAGYFGTMLYNPNNVAAEASPVTTVLEMIVGDELCKMLGYNISGESKTQGPKAWGHITCDGSIANNEAMWAARNLKYYPISLAAAIKNEPLLQKAGALKIRLADGSVTTIAQADSWDLLNLSVDEVLSLPDRLNSEFHINLDLLNDVMNDYSIQNIGFDGLNKYIDSGIKSPVLMAASTCHYSWPKSAAVLGIGANNLIKIYVDENARLHIGRLKEELQNALDNRMPVLMVVAVIGTTEESAVDPLKDIVEVREEFRKKGLNFVIHSDAAWGGYFTAILRQPERQISNRFVLYTPTLTMNAYVTEQYAHIHQSDSITIDPHKAGYIPYPAGGLCYKNGAMRNLVAFAAPVVYHGGVDPTVGIYGLEGSKPGAAAAAAYMSHQVIPLDQSGYGQILGKCLFNSKRLYSAFITMAEPDDPFIIVPFQRLPAEKNGEGPDKIKQQYEFIKEEIVPKTNEQIMANPQAVALLPELGSDQIIITYTFNFKENGVLNKSVDKLNELNLNIFQALSLSPGDHDHPSKTPMYLTQSQFDNESYGKSFVDDYKKRLGLSIDNDEPVNILISTTMNPWLTDTSEGNFIPELVKALRQTVLEQVEKLVGALEEA